MRSIFEYTNYRVYLTDYYQWAKTNVRGFSHRSFLQKAGMSGPNYLKRVMEGVHKLTDNSIPKFAKALNLSDKESHYFQFLVYFNQSKTLEEKDKYFEILMELKSPHTNNLLEKRQYDYYQNWYNIAVREILAYFDFKGNLEDLGKEISPPQSPKKVKKAIEILLDLGLIEKKPEGGYAVTSNVVETGPEVKSLLIPKFHKAMAKLGEEAITRYKKDERYITSLSMSISPEIYDELVKQIDDFRKKIRALVTQEVDPDRAYHLNLQLFPISNLKSKRRKRSD